MHYTHHVLLLCLLPFVAAAQNTDTLRYYIVSEPNMIFIPATPKTGSEIGLTTEQEGYLKKNNLEIPTDEPRHRIDLEPFYISKHEITFEEYDRYCLLMGFPFPSDNGWGRGKRPVINVNWYDAVAYCNWLSRQEGLRPCYTIDRNNKDTYGRDMVLLDPNASGYRLPTEAEWEYAARATQPYVFSGNDAIGAVGWYDKNSKGMTHPICRKSENKWGLCDMTGNVAEWCWDWYSDYPIINVRYYKGPDGGFGRVVRGGSWNYSAECCRVGLRHTNVPHRRSPYIGFRVARTAPPTQ